MMIGTSEPLAAQLAREVAPVAVGQHQVQQDEIERARAVRASASDSATVTSNPSRFRVLENGPEIDSSSSTNSTRGFTPPRLGREWQRDG